MPPPTPSPTPPAFSMPSAAGFARGFGEGAWDGVVSMATGIGHLGMMSLDGLRQAGSLLWELRDAQARREAAAAVKEMAQSAKRGAVKLKEFGEYLAEDPKETLLTARDGTLAAANAVKEEGKKLGHAFEQARAQGQGSQFVGKAVGRTAFEVASLMVGAGEAAKTGKLAEVGSLTKMAKAETTMLPCGKIVAVSEVKGVAAAEAVAAKAAKFTPEGWIGQAVDHPVGRDMIESMVKNGTDPEAAVGYVQKMLESGVELAEKKPIKAKEKLYKLVANQANDYTPFWMTAEELDKLKGLSNEEIANKLGLPLESMPKDGAPFMVQEIEALQDTDVYVSQVAKTVEGSTRRSGGATQTMVTQRGERSTYFSKPSAPKPFR